MSEGTKRRLAAIVSADVVGYSRLMGADETGTLSELKTHRSELIDPLIEKHGGRIVKTTGDGLLLEFPSVVTAVECSVAVQDGMTERNASISDDTAVCFRIGVHLGDIIVEGDDIFGDGVNVAARLEGLSEPNGLALSDDAYRQVRDRLDIDWRNGGEHEVKNIARPIQVWRWLPALPQKVEAASCEHEKLPPPDKPSIAVLPFDNLSGDPEQEYFSDGISEDIIAGLSHLPWFFVIARNSSFAFKGRATEVKRIAQELGVQYLVEGSVRKVGNRIRITAQLIDAPQDHHIWADRYDRELTDVFAVQDEITEKIIGAVAPEFMAAEMHRSRHKETRNLDAWDLLMQAHWHLNKFTKENNREARALLEKVIAIDPNNDLAFSDLAASYTIGLYFSWYDEPAKALEAAREAAEKAVTINDRNVSALLALANVDVFFHKFDEAVSRARYALDLAPNSPDAHGWLGCCLLHACEWKEAMERLNAAIRIAPRDPSNAIWYAAMTMALFQDCRYEECIEWCEAVLRDIPNPLPAMHRPMAASYAMLGRMAEAREATEHLKSRLPSATAEDMRSFPFKDPTAITHYTEALSEAEAPT